MQLIKSTLDTRHQNSVIGNVTQFDDCTLELQILTDGVIDEAWEEPQFELLAMKRDNNPVRECDQDKFTILSKEEHKVQIELKEQFLTYRGSVKIQLVIKDGGRLSTTLFYLVIGQSLDHDIVESHRDVKVLDDLEAYVKQGFDDLAYQEQRMVAVEQSTNDLNETMNANEAERNKAEITRQKTFDINEAHRTRTFNNQVEEQGVAFSNAQTQRDESFIESQQSMSQDFETSQRERESAFNELQKSNQKTFETIEQKRQTTFAQSQSANKQTFTQNETERQHIFESNESSRQKSESQRVKNESERVFAETKRADAEVIRQKKMTEFEEKATQLSEDLDNQVARVDKFVAANEEKLLGPHDKTDYMGNAHKSVKDVNDANVEYILGEVNTVHYEGQHITATDTIEKQVRSAILNGQTLVNNLKKITLPKTYSSPTNLDIALSFAINTNEIWYVYIDAQNVTSDRNYLGLLSDGSWQSNLANYNDGFSKSKIISTSNNATHLRIAVGNGTIINSVVLIKEDVDFINQFWGMQSVRMPVLTTTGKNLFNCTNVEDINNSYTVVNMNNQNYITTDTLVEKGKQYTLSLHANISGTTGNILSLGYMNYSNIVGGVEKASHNIVTIDSVVDKTTSITFTAQTTDYIKIYIATGRRGYNVVLSNVQIEEGSVATPYEPPKSNILTVNEDIELRGIDETRDEVDLITGEVTERVGEIVLDGSNDEEWRFNKDLGDGSFHQYVTKANLVDAKKVPQQTVISDKLISLASEDNNNCIWIYDGGTVVVHSSSLTVDELKMWLASNPITVQYQLATESIKTVDLNGQKVYSYDCTTHYSCSAAEGSLIPTLAIDVPTNLPALVSRQRVTIESQKEQIITLEQENEQLIAQNEVQDIDISLNQDAINFMLFASATMSVNNESRNNEGVNAMAAYLANQILKGKLDYTLVVSRYGSYKEDIDTILIAEGKQDLIK